MIGPTGCDGAVSCVKRLLQDCRCGRIKVHCHLVLSAHSRAPPCKLHRFNHNHSKPHHQNQPKFPFVEYNMFKGHRFLGACRHVEGTVKCTGEGGRVPSHRYSNKKHTPLVVASTLATRSGRMPSTILARHKYAPISQQLLSLRNLPDLNHALLPEVAIVLLLHQ